MNLFYTTNLILQEFLDKESEMKGVIFNFKEAECMVVSRRIFPRCELKTEDFQVKHIQKFNYFGSVLQMMESVVVKSKGELG